MVRTLSVFAYRFFTIIQFFKEFWVYKIVQFKNALAWNLYENTNKILIIKFHNRLIHFNIKANNTNMYIFDMLHTCKTETNVASSLHYI